MKRTILLTDKKNHTITAEYEIFRSKRKTYSLSLNDSGILRVRIPIHVTDYEVEQILLQKQFWITDRIAEFMKQQNNRPKNHFTPEQQLALEKRYRQAAREWIPSRVTYYMNAYPYILPARNMKITIRDQKTRWGSCSSKGSLSFNWRLMLAPPGILDYVIVHELCHLIHMNHSQEFWKCVGDILPDYKERRKWLKDHGNELTLS
ncbi:M48 family metallopeptidase [Kineothrix sp. MB12-C1]|uniref:M48 family metallopeptidase n=1 Tax=Kineothrix sp. MB12-C1 TaxID=3070215 RepID=UPI0027D29870|nr:SprT family zinc-dependent metalloprotease [Kineothrix sp. MB12-C1]WMC92889.1 SprT family zinc-dependent metalloprotease [Kineothrix sp. MB12-C1]